MKIKFKPVLNGFARTIGLINTLWYFWFCMDLNPQTHRTSTLVPTRGTLFDKSFSMHLTQGILYTKWVIEDLIFNNGMFAWQSVDIYIVRNDSYNLRYFRRIIFHQNCWSRCPVELAHKKKDPFELDNWSGLVECL